MDEAGRRHQDPRAEAHEPPFLREGDLGDDPVRLGAQGPRMRRERDVHDRPDARADEMHGRDAEPDLVVTDERCPGHRREEGGSLDRVPDDAADDLPVEHQLPGAETQGDGADGRVVLQVGEQGRVRRLEAELLGVTVEPGRRRQVGQAGAEHPRGAQGDDRQHHAQERRAQRNGGPAGPALQCVADADHRGWWRTQGDQVPHHRRGAGSPGPLVHPPGARRPQGRPDAQRQDDHHGGQRAEQEHERVERDSGGVLGQPGLAEGCDGGQQRGDHDGAHGAGQAHHQVPCHVESEELPAGHADGDQGRVVLALDGALAGQGLAHDRQPDQRGERSEDPPPDGLRVDGPLDRGGRSVLGRGAGTCRHCPGSIV